MDTSVSVLVLDDSGAAARVVSQLLLQCGFGDVQWVTDAGAAYELMETKQYGLVLCDVEMDRVDGLTVLRTLRADRIHWNVCFVLMTAGRDTSRVVEGKECGADGFILKPFTQEALKEKLKRIQKLSLVS